MPKSINEVDFHVRYFKADEIWVCNSGGLGETIHASGPTPESALQDCMTKVAVYIAGKR